MTMTSYLAPGVVHRRVQLLPGGLVCANPEERRDTRYPDARISAKKVYRLRDSQFVIDGDRRQPVNLKANLAESTFVIFDGDLAFRPVDLARKAHLFWSLALKWLELRH
jgi:hypothetical protein